MIKQLMETTLFRRRVKAAFPGMKIKLKTIDFTDLARKKRTFAYLVTDKTEPGLTMQNCIDLQTWGKEAGLMVMINNYSQE
jgi:hypothetical protein